MFLLQYVTFILTVNDDPTILGFKIDAIRGHIKVNHVMRMSAIFSISTVLANTYHMFVSAYIHECGKIYHSLLNHTCCYIQLHMTHSCVLLY